MSIEKYLFGEDVPEEIRRAIKMELDKRSRTEEEVREGEELFRSLAEGLVQGILIHRDFKPLFVNRTYANIFGYTPDEILGMESIFGLVATYERERFVQYKNAHVRGEYAPSKFEYQGIRKDNSFIWLDTRVWMIKWRGEPAILTVVFDIALREREIELRRSEERFRALSGAAFEGIAIHERNKILEVNQTLVDMFGYEIPEIIGKDVSEFTVLESRDLLASFVVSDVQQTQEMQGLRKDGSTFPAEISGRVITYRDRMIRALAIRDVTERKQAEEELQKRQRETETLAEASRIFNSSLEIEAIFQEIAKLVSEEIGESCAIFRIGENELWPITVYSKGEEDKKSLIILTDRPIPIEGTITGSCVKNKVPALIEDADSDQRFSDLFKNIIDVKSYICVPLIARGEVLGLLSTSTLSEDRRFGSNDLRLLVSLADRAAAALENSNLYGKTRAQAQRLSVVNEISRAVNSTLDMESVYGAIVEQLKRALSFEFTMSIALYNPEDDSFVFSRIFDPIGLTQDLIEVDRRYPGDSLNLSRSYKEKKTFLYRTDKTVSPPEMRLRNQLIEKGLRSFLNIPLIIVEQECIGTLNLSSTDPDAFTDDEIVLLETVSSHLAAAIKNARMYEGLEKANLEMAFINSITDLFSKPFEISQMLKIALEKASDFVGLNEGAIYGLNEKRDELHLLAHTDATEDYLKKIRVLPVEDSLNGYVVRSGKSQLGDEFSSHPQISVEAVKERGYKSFVIVPIRSKDRILGTLFLASKDVVRAISEDDVRLLEALGMQIGVALENANLQQQLIQAEKLSAIGDLVSGVTHELNNPLSVILGYSQMMLWEGSSEENKQACEAIIKSVERCRRITNNLLSFAKEVSPEKKSISINECFQRVLDIVSYHMNVDGIKVELDLDGELPMTLADEVQMQQVFLNVINNAHHAILEKGKPGIIRISSKKIGGVIFISCIDNGIGMDEATVKRVFDPFFTTKEVGKGTGLGLSASLGIVRSHNGNMRIHSKPGEGTEVIISIPILGVQEESEEITIVDESQAFPEGKRILIVDDEEDILSFYKNLFAKYNWEIVIATDGVEALSIIFEGVFDIVLCDLKMPGMGGRELYEILRKRKLNILDKIIVSTGDIVSEDTAKFLKENSIPHINKPVDITELIKIISAMIAEE